MSVMRFPEYASVKKILRLTSGIKQKRLVLANLKELYAEFKKCHPDIKKLGFHHLLLSVLLSVC